MSGDLDWEDIKIRAEAEMEIFQETFSVSPALAQLIDSAGIGLGFLMLWKLGGPAWTAIGIGLVLFGGLGTMKRVGKYGLGGGEEDE